MTFAEARQLCLDAHIPYLIPHHFGMFEFNTIDKEELRREACKPEFGVCCLLPAVERYFILEAEPHNIFASNR